MAEVWREQARAEDGLYNEHRQRSNDTAFVGSNIGRQLEHTVRKFLPPRGVNPGFTASCEHAPGRAWLPGPYTLGQGAIYNPEADPCPFFSDSKRFRQPESSVHKP